MKGHALFLLFICIYTFANAQNKPALQGELIEHEFQKIIKIDALDTVIFNMCKSVRVGDYINIPVSIKSDDQINALDFSMKFNHDHLVYDTVINHTNYIQLTEYYNPIDATLRVTSNSFTSYDKDTSKVMSIRFKLLTTKLEGTDLNTVLSYLNGDKCSIKLLDTDCHIVSANENIKQQQVVHVYPNPAKDHLTVEVPENANAEILDINGKKCLLSFKIFNRQRIDFQNLPNGIYLLKIANDNFHTVTKLIINQ